MRTLIILILTVCTKGLFAQHLNGYLEIAAENHPALKAAFNQHLMDLEKVPQIGALPDPNLAFGYFILPTETRVGPQRAKFSLNQQFPWFGTLKQQKDLASSQALASYQIFEKARNELFLEVKNQYYLIWELSKRLEFEKENIALLESLEALAEVKVQSTQGNLVDLLRIQMSLEEAQTLLRIDQGRLMVEKEQFNLLLNREKDSRILLDSLPPPGYSMVPVLDSNLFFGNPAIVEIDQEMIVSESREKLVQKQGSPKINLGLDYVLVTNGPNTSLPDNGQDILMPMIGLSLPIGRKKYNAGIKEAQIQQEMLQYEKEAKLLDLEGQFLQAQFASEEAKANFDLVQSQIDKSTQALELLQTAYSSNARDFEELLRMQQQILNLQISKLKNVHNWHSALAEIEYLTNEKLK
jgi:outer membrane protein TolC